MVVMVVLVVVVVVTIVDIAIDVIAEFVVVRLVVEGTL